MSRQALEGIFPIGVWVRGELRNVKIHSSGHIYFLLVDEVASVDGVIWRNVAQNLGFKPEDGMKVETFGSPTLYEKNGRYQFSVRKLIPDGEGARAIAFRQLKEKLFSQGLFDPKRKRKLPAFPFRIGVITSPTGAAIRDIIHVIQRRAPYVTIIIRPAKVQGKGSAKDIVAGIEEFNQYGNVDLLVIGRGGGNEEDLWCFNDEELARTIFASKIPIISAVGHEIDFTISDYVADMRAPTPSAAAEIAVKDIRELKSQIENYLFTTRNKCLMVFDSAKSRLEVNMQRTAWTEPLNRIREWEQRLDEQLSKAIYFEKNIFERSANRLLRNADRLTNLSVKNTLKRGFVIVHKDGIAIDKSSFLKSNDLIGIEFYDDVKKARIE
ncbi:exodeoxyribonuclease VII large subunit [bacterium]|nr:exodeoxyribonuclease VII large subunit [bacterium]